MTRFDLYTYPDYRVWYTLKVYNASDSNRVMKASVEVQKAMEDDDRISFYLSINASVLTVGHAIQGMDNLPVRISRI